MMVSVFPGTWGHCYHLQIGNPHTSRFISSTIHVAQKGLRHNRVCKVCHVLSTSINWLVPFSPVWNIWRYLTAFYPSGVWVLCFHVLQQTVVHDFSDSEHPLGTSLSCTVCVTILKNSQKLKNIPSNLFDMSEVF